VGNHPIQIKETKIRPSFEDMMKEIVQKITPELLGMYVREESGELAIRIGSGNLKQAVRKEVVL